MKSEKIVCYMKQIRNWEIPKILLFKKYGFGNPVQNYFDAAF
jgi:hypothetical protein